jgi:hypothetical protein
LADFLQAPYTPGWNYDNDKTPRAVASRVTPDSGAQAVVSVSSVTIQAPADADLRALAPAFFADPANAGFQRAQNSNPVEFVVKDGGAGKYVMNDESKILNCSNADILVNGPLYLRGLKVAADNGCRIYATGTVFIEDGVTYAGEGASQSLQITSSRAIVMGINKARLNNRLLVDYRGLQLAQLDYLTLANQVMADANAVGTLRDAQDDYGGTRASIDYSGLLLNAPIVHSRYLGQVKGAIVAEAALFALGAFHFQFDQVFLNTSILPLLKKPILSATQ